jgi:hypothetical protein
MVALPFESFFTTTKGRAKAKMNISKSFSQSHWKDIKKEKNVDLFRSALDDK